MNTLFWTAFGAMACLLVARWLVPKLAPDTRIASLLVHHVSFGFDEPEDADSPLRR